MSEVAKMQDHGAWLLYIKLHAPNLNRWGAYYMKKEYDQ